MSVKLFVSDKSDAFEVFHRAFQLTILALQPFEALALGSAGPARTSVA
jgi:hypothetical protein